MKKTVTTPKESVDTKYIVNLTNLRLLLQNITLPMVIILLNFIFFYITISNPSVLKIITASIFFIGLIIFYIVIKKHENRS